MISFSFTKGTVDGNLKKFLSAHTGGHEMNVAVVRDEKTDGEEVIIRWKAGPSVREVIGLLRGFDLKYGTELQKASHKLHRMFSEADAQTHSEELTKKSGDVLDFLSIPDEGYGPFPAMENAFSVEYVPMCPLTMNKDGTQSIQHIRNIKKIILDIHLLKDESYEKKMIALELEKENVA